MLLIAISVVSSGYVETKKIINQPQIKKIIPISQVQEVIRYE